jgi:zinc protease
VLPPQDLETLFQLLYLRFTQPRADPVAFAAMQAQARALLANRMASPDAVFNQTIDTAVSGNNPRRAPETPATVGQWDLAKSMAFYKARFADASNFTFVFVGSFKVDAIKPLVETWLASLPATHANETWRDVGVMPPTGVIEQTIQKGIAPKSQVAIVLSGPFEYDEPHQLAFRTATLLLQSRLTDTIRQELGGTYSITVNPDSDKFPRPTYSVRIEWTCDPARTAALAQRVFDEIAFVRKTAISPRQLTAIRGGLLREFEQKSQDNRYVLAQIAQAYQDGDPENAAVEKEPQRIEALTAEAIQQAAQTYLDTRSYVKVTLMPETK